MFPGKSRDLQQPFGLEGATHRIHLEARHLLRPLKPASGTFSQIQLVFMPCPGGERGQIQLPRLHGNDRVHWPGLRLGQLGLRST